MRVISAKPATTPITVKRALIDPELMDLGKEGLQNLRNPEDLKANHIANLQMEKGRHLEGIKNGKPLSLVTIKEVLEETKNSQGLPKQRVENPEREERAVVIQEKATIRGLVRINLPIDRKNQKTGHAEQKKKESSTPTKGPQPDHTRQPREEKRAPVTDHLAARAKQMREKVPAQKKDQLEPQRNQPEGVHP